MEKGEAWPKEYRRNLEPPRDEICICSLRVHGMHQKGKHDCMLLKHPGDHLEQVRCEGSPLYLVWEEVKLPCPVARENKSQVSFQFSDLNKASWHTQSHPGRESSSGKRVAKPVTLQVLQLWHSGGWQNIQVWTFNKAALCTHPRSFNWPAHAQIMSRPEIPSSDHMLSPSELHQWQHPWKGNQLETP